jgi:TPR repeat protein
MEVKRYEYVQKKAEKGSEYFLKKAEKGNISSQAYLGWCYKYGGQELLRDNKLAFFWFKKASKQGDISSQYYLGRCYEFGEGTKENLKKAVFW